MGPPRERDGVLEVLDVVAHSRNRFNGAAARTRRSVWVRDQLDAITRILQWGRCVFRADLGAHSDGIWALIPGALGQGFRTTWARIPRDLGGQR